MPNVERGALQLAFQRLDSVNLRDEFRMRASVMKTVPGFLQGPYRQAMHVALDEICVGLDRSDNVRQERGWKLWMLLPRMLLHRPARGGLIAKEKLSRRFEDFVHGRWSHLIDDGRTCAEQSSKIATRKRRRGQHDDVERRAARAEALVQMGELSAGRQALEGEALAPGNEHTLHQLQRRPAVPRRQMPEDLERFWPGRRFELDEKQFFQNLRSFRRGAAAGPSGMTAEHLRPLLNAPRILHLLFRASESLAAGQVPQSTVDVLKLGRITTLQKARGGVRGIVAGDIVRRLVSRTMAQQLGPEVERATAPFQYTMRTRAGCECVAHALQALCEVDPELTILSIDGISAYDSISRVAMLQGLREVNGQAVPYVRMFYGQPSTYIWEDEHNVVHSIHQGEGGEQGDALMPLLFSLGQHRALQAVSRLLRPGEKLFAFLDDIYVLCPPARVVEVYGILQAELWRHAGIQINGGKTQVWNQAGVCPPRCEVLEQIARQEDPEATVDRFWGAH